MGNIRWLGVVSSLMMGAMLIAPMHSEATVGVPTVAPTVKISLNTAAPGGQSANIAATTSSCSATDAKTYTACYAIAPTTASGVLVTNATGTNTARVLIADKDGSGGTLDLVTLTGVTFNAQGAAGADHTIRVFVTVTLDGASNPGGAGTMYQFAMRMGGNFNPNSDTTSVNDFVKLSACADFGAGACTFALSPDLTFTVGGADSALPSSFSVSQVPTYPTGNPCDKPTGTNTCKPTIAQTFTIRTFGPDKLTLTTSVKSDGGDCNLTPPVPGGQSITSARPCQAVTTHIKGDFIQAENDEARENRQNNIPPADAATSGCQDPDGCEPSVITIYKYLDDNCGGGELSTLSRPLTDCKALTFTFHINGPTATTATITTDSSGFGTTSVTVNAGDYTVTEDQSTGPAAAWNLVSNNCATFVPVDMYGHTCNIHNLHQGPASYGGG